MTEQDYIAKRIDDQIKWYSQKSQWNQKRYKRLKTIIIVLSVSIPFLTGMIGEDQSIAFWLKIIIGTCGVIIAAGEGILSLQKYQDNWTEYRIAAETLKREKLLFQTQSGPYRDQQASLQNLVERVENFTENENKSWLQYIKVEKTDQEDQKDA